MPCVPHRVNPLLLKFVFFRENKIRNGLTCRAIWRMAQSMKLEKYIEILGQSQTEWAKKNGFIQGTINRYCTGARFPTREMIRRIEKATDGAVTVLDWYKERGE